VDDTWEHLIAALDAWGTAAEIAPGRIAVTRPDGKPATIVMTPEEYDEMLAITGRSPEAGVQDVIGSLHRLGAGQRFAVYGQYRLESSTQDTLPGIADALPPGTRGEWSTGTGRAG